MLMKGNGRFDYEIVGESYRQQNLASLAGPKVPGGHDLDCLAALVFHDDNPHDSNAVAVFIVHKNQQITIVGYLPRKQARNYRKHVALLPKGPDPQGMLCRAKIVGGWVDGLSDHGMYGVRLDLRLPLTFGTHASWENWSKRLL